jgi:hypothetical protein
MLAPYPGPFCSRPFPAGQDRRRCGRPSSVASSGGGDEALLGVEGPYPAAVISRAVIEQCGCLLYESRKIAEAWAGAKRSNVPDELARINQVRSALSALMTSAAFGTRLSAVEGRSVRATNVLTYVDKLAALTGDAQIRKWYDWLSDAAHPAFAARIAGSSDPFMHDTRAVMLRYHDRSPLHLEGRGGLTRFSTRSPRRRRTQSRSAEL